MIASFYTYFQCTENRKDFQIQYLTLDTWPGIIIFFMNPTLIFLMRNLRVKYQVSSFGFENLAHLQSIENKCKQKWSTQHGIPKLIEQDVLLDIDTLHIYATSPR